MPLRDSHVKGSADSIIPWQVQHGGFFFGHTAFLREESATLAINPFYFFSPVH